MIKYRLNNPDGSYQETLSIEEAEKFGVYDIIEEDEVQVNIISPISRMQFFLNVWRVLRIKESDIMSYIDTIKDEDTRIEVSLMFNNMTEVDRYNPYLIFMAKEMSISDEILNQIFQ